MACILIELYTGEMFFPTHENVEHLAMMEKQCGPFPYWMAKEAQSPFREKFDLNASESDIRRIGYRLKWPKIAGTSTNIKNVNDMKLLRVFNSFLTLLGNH